MYTLYMYECVCKLSTIYIHVCMREEEFVLFLSCQRRRKTNENATSEVRLVTVIDLLLDI